VAQAIELELEVMEKRAEELAVQKKLELKDELTVLASFVLEPSGYKVLDK